MIANAGALTNACQPEIDDAGFTQTEQHARAVDDQSDGQDPNRAEHQKELSRNYGIDDEVVVGHASEHLRASEGCEKWGSLQIFQRLPSERSGGADPRNDAGGAEQDEAADDDHGAVAPVKTSAEHQQSDAGDGDDGDNGGDGAEKRALKPLNRFDDRTGALRVSQDCLGGGDRGGHQGDTGDDAAAKRRDKLLHWQSPFP